MLRFFKNFLLLTLTGAIAGHIWFQNRPNPSHWLTWRYGEVAPLAMDGGDPYLRALMRTISASEANDANPYTILYGGKHIRDLGQHPDRCVPIRWGPNVGQCTTAAGRYQFLSTTWAEKAHYYHPRPPQWFEHTYSFEPEYQDRVVYGWLNDPHAWGVDIPTLLRQGEIQAVLELLSGTWTSLGYGIEDNLITPSLERIYHTMLEQELSSAQSRLVTPLQQ